MFAFSLSYAYAADYRDAYQRPAVWMPRPEEFIRKGRRDIRRTLRRFGGSERVSRLAGMVPCSEWYYFEDQLELLMELQGYLKKHGNGNFDSIPAPKDVRRHGFEQLYTLLKANGGQNFLADRLGMNTSDSNYSPFSLEFAIRLLSFIRELELRKNPPVADPSIKIPSPSHLLALEEEEAKYLHESIMKCGGYENVARRLGFAFLDRGRDDDNESLELRMLFQAEATVSTENPPSLANTRSSESALQRKDQVERKPNGYWNETTLVKEM